MCGWIKLHRKLTDWEWYSDVNTTRVFLHLLLVANHKDAKWRGISIKRGQRLTSLSKLAEETNLSIKNIRTSIKRLKATHEVASSSNAQHTVFTVLNYDLYQGEAHEAASNGQANGKQGATNNNDKKEKNENNSNDLDAFSFFWSNMSLKKAAKAKAEPAFNKASKKETDPMVFAQMLVDDTKARLDGNQFGFDKLNPTTYLNGRRWEDDKPKNDCDEYKYVLDAFNEAMSNAERVPFADMMTTSMINGLKNLYAKTNLSPDNIERYFDHVATSADFGWARGETGNSIRGLSYYLTEDAYKDASEPKR